MKEVILTDTQLISDLIWICNQYYPKDMCEAGRECGYIMERYIKKELGLLRGFSTEPIRLIIENYYNVPIYVDLPIGHINIEKLQYHFIE